MTNSSESVYFCFGFQVYTFATMQSTILSHLRSLYPRGCSVYDLLLHCLQLSESQRGQLDALAKQIKDNTKSKAKLSSGAFSRLALSQVQAKTLRDVHCLLHVLIQSDDSSIVALPPDSIDRKTHNRKKTIEDTTGELTARVLKDWPKMLRLLPLPDQPAITTSDFGVLCRRVFFGDDAFVMACLEFLKDVQLVESGINGFRAQTWMRTTFVDDWILLARPLSTASPPPPPRSILDLYWKTTVPSDPVERQRLLADHRPPDEEKTKTNKTAVPLVAKKKPPKKRKQKEALSLEERMVQQQQTERTRDQKQTSLLQAQRLAFMKSVSPTTPKAPLPPFDDRQLKKCDSWIRFTTRMVQDAEEKKNVEGIYPGYNVFVSLGKEFIAEIKSASMSRYNGVTPSYDWSSMYDALVKQFHEMKTTERLDPEQAKARKKAIKAQSAFHKRWDKRLKTK
jgi:hypothetical protein